MKRFLSVIILTATFCSCGGDRIPFYKDASQPVERRVKDLLSRMTVEEKVGQMNQYVAYIDENAPEKKQSILDVAAKGHIGSVFQANTVEWANELQKAAMQTRLQIPILVGADAVHGAAMICGTTVYPMPINFASTWNPELIRKMARQTALELRSLGSHWSFFPNMDIVRDPRWGRIGETFGEDPMLVSDMGCAMIDGYQMGDFTGTDRVVACANHFVAGGSAINGINFWGSDISERSLRTFYLKPFYDAVKKANLFTVMGSHNTINDIPCHTNKELMTDIMRDEYGFKGFYVSDFTDLERLHQTYMVARDFKEGYVQAVNAGLDMHMQGPGFYEPVVEAVKEGIIPMARVDEAVSKILEAKFRLGLFEEPLVDEKLHKSVVRHADHGAHALEVARNGIVLLENRHHTLPIQTDKVKKILVTGPNADNKTILGDWTNPQPDENITTIIEGMTDVAKHHNVKVDYFNVGENIRKGLSINKIDEAVRKAANYDMVVLALGERTIRYDKPTRTDGENFDRTNINLLGNQLELAQKMKAAGKPVVVVYINMRPLSEPWISANADALVEAWCPGQAGGQAVAEVLFGDVNPGAKLPVTVLRSVGQTRLYYNMLPNAGFRNTYVEEKRTPLYPFGYGKSYTTFSISEPQLAKSVLGKQESTTVSVTVTNTGDRKGDEVVQMYIRDDYSYGVVRPVKDLRGYQRISLEAGESQEVVFDITPEMLAYYDLNMDFKVEEGTFKIMVGNSSGDADLKSTSLEVTESYPVAR